MQQRHARPDNRALRVQLGLVAALPLIYALPSIGGSMLLVPLTPSARASVARLAINAGAELVVLGPISGSIVVRTDRPRFARRMIAAGVLPLAIGANGCGAAGKDEA